MLPKTLYWLILAAVTAIAAYRGKREERLAAFICVAGSILTVVVSRSQGVTFRGIETGVMIVDLAALGAFTAIALVSQRFWPLWVAGFQLASSLAHLLRGLNAKLVPYAYAVAERFWIYPILLVIVVGAFRAARRRRLPAVANDPR